MDQRKHITLTILLTASLMVAMTILLPATRGLAQNAGKVGAVNQEATGTPPGEGSHTLVIGASVVYKESIRTSAQGTTQILFPDSSTLNVGRNSSIVIDEFVYDPNSKSGTMLASISQGALRFVGGQISHSSGVTVRTPVATLGIRGGVATIVYPIPSQLGGSDANLAGCGGELVVGHVGQATLKNAAGGVTIRPGFAACVNGPNDPIAAPFRISDAALAIIVANMTSGPGQTGGTTTPPAGPFITLNDVGTIILDDPAHPPGVDPLGFISIFGFGNSVAGSKSGSNQINNGLPPPPVVNSGPLTSGLR
jgi:hypothetical protein